MRWCFDESGQSSVEAAFVIPILMLAMLMLSQPGIYLYDRIVMESAANQGLRMLSTMPESYGYSGFEDLLETQLSAIPDIDIFQAQDWDIELTGNEATKEVTVCITNEIRPLPLVSLGARLFGATNENGNIPISVKVTSKTQPEWVWSCGKSPSEWAGQW